MYAKIVSGSVVKYPYSLSELYHDNPNTSFPSHPSSALLAEYYTYEVAASAYPSFDPDTQLVEERQPLLSGEIWVQQWEVVPLPVEEIAARLAARRASMTCSARQALLALLEFGVLESVEAWVSTQPREIQIEWSKATQFDRTWPLIESARVAMGWPEATVDALFALAMTK